MIRWQLITEDFPPGFTGGIASWATDLARALSASGAQSQVLARHTGNTAAFDKAQPYPVRRMRGRHWGRWRGRWAQLALTGQIEAEDRLIFANWALATHVAP